MNVVTDPVTPPPTVTCTTDIDLNYCADGLTIGFSHELSRLTPSANICDIPFGATIATSVLLPIQPFCTYLFAHAGSNERLRLTEADVQSQKIVLAALACTSHETASRVSSNAAFCSRVAPA